MALHHTDTKLALDFGQRNDMPGRGRVRAMLERDLGREGEAWKAVNTRRKYWTNDVATAVLLIDEAKIKPLAFGRFVREAGFDEYDMEPSATDEGKTVLRIWWD